MSLDQPESTPARPWMRGAAWWSMGTVALSVVAGSALGISYAGPGAAAGAAGMAAGVVPAAAAVWMLQRWQAEVTAADRVTLLRVALTGVLTAGLVLVLVGDIAARSWLLAGLAAAALVLDLVDGWVARRRTPTRQGAVLDTESDAALLLVLSGLAAEAIGGWVLAIGLMRYAFLALTWAAPRLRQPLPHNRLRPVIGALQGMAMLAVLIPAVPTEVAAPVAAAALLLLTLSFAWDILTLARRRTPVVERPVSAQWLGQRRRADHRAREQAAGLLETLNAHLQSVTSAGEPVTVIDVGAGTGSNLAWLAPRLDCAQRWILVDHDTQILSALDHPEELDGVEEVIQVVGTVQELPALVRTHTAGQGPVLITCSALLDVLSWPDADALAETICAPTTGSSGAAGIPAALLSLSVTGEVDFSPAHRYDQIIAAAFNAHQRRDGLLGPDAVEALVPALQRRGARTALRSTDWQLDQADGVLVQQYVTERAEVAVEHELGLEAAAKIWVQDRLDQLAAGQLRIRVGHTDLLSLPAQAAAAQPPVPRDTLKG